MEYEIFNIFRNYTLEALIIGFGAFLLTYLIKLPIKKLTGHLEENKRKMVNIIIMFVPLLISTIASVAYYGVTQHQWLSLLVLDSSVSAWILSLSIYAITSRIVLVIKGIKSGKLKVNSDLAKQTVSYVKDTIKSLNKENKTAEKSLTSITKKLEGLTQIRDLLVADTVNLDLTKIADLNLQISNLQQEEKANQNKIASNQSLITNYNTKLYTKQSEKN